MFHSDGSVIVSFVVYFKTPVTANEGEAPWKIIESSVTSQLEV